MFQIITTVILLSILNTMVIFDFSKNSDLKNWYIVNDNVMGGVSRSTFDLDTDGNAVFKGSVSLENNGGFCSTRYGFEKLTVIGFETIAIRLKGDGKRYQFRIKSKRNNYFSFIGYFNTSGEWQTVEITMKNMYPSFRGRKLDQPDFSDDTIEEITFLIGNNKEENFKLVIDKIELK